MPNQYDVVVVGAGHNGLTAGAYLAKAGHKVLILERRDVVGGAAVTEAVWPGFQVDVLAHRGALRPDIVRDLQLVQHGLRAGRAAGPILALQPGGPGLVLWPRVAASVEGLGRFSKADARRWPDFVALLTKLAGFLNEAYALTMPRMPRPDPAETPALAQLGLKLRGLGKKDMMEAIRLLPMSVAELLDDWFETDALKGALAAQGIHGLMQGPMGAGSAFLLAHHWANQDGVFKTATAGGVGQITRALAAAAQAFGAEIRTGAEVAHVNVQDGRAAGVVLAGGDEIAARLVVSNADPRRTFLGLVGAQDLDPSFVWAVQNIKLRGCVAKVNLALDGLPAFTAGAELGSTQGTLVISPSIRYLERAYDAAKYGAVSERPYLEMTLPTVADPSLAPAGKHVLSVHVQYAPYHLQSGSWTPEAREALGDLVVEALAEYAPGIQSLITQRQVLTPKDLEAVYALTEGNIYHGEMMLDQILFMRPMPGWGQYRTPIDGLYLCGAGTHPGGGLTGAPGRNAAKQMLKDLRSERVRAGEQG